MTTKKQECKHDRGIAYYTTGVKCGKMFVVGGDVEFQENDFETDNETYACRECGKEFKFEEAEALLLAQWQAEQDKETNTKTQ